METNLLVDNIHCPSCILAIEELWTGVPLAQDASKLSVSLLTGIVSFTLQPSHLPIFTRLLRQAGFNVVSVAEAPSTATVAANAEHGSSRWYDTARSQAKRLDVEDQLQLQREAAHKASCSACRDDATGKGKARERTIPVHDVDEDLKTTILVGGMTCSSCIGSVEHILEADPRIKSFVVTLLPGNAVVTHSAIPDQELVIMLENGGYEALIIETTTAGRARPPPGGWVESSFVIEGMTCA